MGYVYEILVIDDDKDMGHSFSVYKDYLLGKGYSTNFTQATDDKEINWENAYDLLMVDYNLKNGFFSDKKEYGNQLIKEFREKNKVSKIIFYSSEFEYSKSNLNKCKLKLSARDIFELINDYKIDGIVSKNNFDMLIDTISANLGDLDPIAQLLIDTKLKYKDDNSNLFFTDSVGNEVSISELLDEYLIDSKIGREFRDQLMSTLVTLLLEYRY